MSLLAEYTAQQQWRNWEQYFPALPLRVDDRVLDLGCSVGAVSHLFSPRVRQVIGIDINHECIALCKQHQRDNEQFLCQDITSLSWSSLGPLDGVWASFSLSYLADPLAMLQQICTALRPNGWVALVDVCCFLSGNLRRTSPFHDQVEAFELTARQTGGYDFAFGARMEDLVQQVGLQVRYRDENVTDPELNFSGPASVPIIHAWEARLARLKKLRNLLGSRYAVFCEEFLGHLQEETHQKRGNLRFVVAQKKSC